MLVALLSGGDWADASVAHLVFDTPMTAEQLDEAWRARQEWYDNKYVPSLYSGARVEYFSFPDWLIRHHGARCATDADVLLYADL